MPTKTASDVYSDFFLANSLFAILAAAVLIWVSWFGYRLQSARFLRLWAGCWAAYLVARLLTMVQLTEFARGLSTVARTLMSAATQFGYYLHVLLLCASVLVLRRRGGRWLQSRQLLAYAVVLLVLVVAIAFATVSTDVLTRLRWRVSLRCALSAVALLAAGVMMLRHGRRIRRFGASFFGSALLLGAAHQLVHAWAFGTRGLYDLAALLAGLEILEVAAIGFGLLLWDQEDKNRQLERSTRALGQRTTELLRAQRLESVGQLAGGVAHDFNNVLTVVLGNTEMLLANPALDDGMRCELEQTRHAALQAAKLTGQLLSLARNPASGVRAIDIAHEAREVLPLLQSLAGGRVAIELRTDPGALRVRLKRGHIEQILLNLVTNGRDAIRGAGSIDLSVRRCRRAGAPCVELVATDTGVGMSEEVRQRVGELFFTTKADSGSGMGMASVRSIVEQTGGTLEFLPVTGGGTMVRVVWPEAQSGPDSESDTRAEVVMAPASATILLAEDDPMVRTVAERSLRAEGFEVLAAETPAVARTIAQGHDGHIDLLLSDVVMPEVSGPQLAAMVQAVRPGIAICFMSGFVSDVDGAELPPGARVLEKPFTPAELVAFVRSVLPQTIETNR